MDIRPLCDKHRRALMVPVMLVDCSQGFKWQLHGCTVSGCTRHYEGSEGYFDVVGGRSLLGKFDKTLGCAEHETMMYLESYSPEADVEVWRCPQYGCHESRIIMTTEKL
jgi:hypothetical protein